MSGTGVKIFSNDMAMDVKYDFCQLYGIGKSVEEINDYILQYRPNDDDEEACAFWSALALIEWQYGVLTDDIKNEAKRIIEFYDDAHLFIKKNNAEDRKIELRQLLELLETENPAPKKRKKTYVYRTPYKQGDVIAFPVKERWVYFHVCGIKRSKKKIPELERDAVHVGLFNLISNNIVDISRITKTAESEAAYLNLDRPGVSNFVRWIYPTGIKEQLEFEKKCVVIGKKLINIRLTPKEKAQMERLAEICGLSLSEYLRKRGLGYEPRPLLDVSFYQLYTQLCDLCNQPISTDVEVALLNLITDIRRELLLPKQETRKEVAAWLQPDSGQSKDG